VIIIIIFKAHLHKATGRKTMLDMQNYDCNGNSTVTMVLWKETKFPLCRIMERHWERNAVSLVVKY